MHRPGKILFNICSRRFLKGCQRILGAKLPMISGGISSPSAPFSNVSVNKPSTTLPEATIKRDKYSHRTHNCGELTIANVGERVELCGWMEYQRMNKFIILRDNCGSTQLMLPDERTDLTETIEGISYETVIRVIGTVNPRPNSQVNKKMTTGEIEILVEHLEILNPSKTQLPFPIRHFIKAKEPLRMQYRYLDLRFPEMQRNLRIRSKVLMKMREFLINKCNFVDIETPTLFRRTPGGAQEFIVPTRNPGKFYSLVQSPQQFKQLLMVGGIDRYFQIARCYRDETGRMDRQPEFTQLDIEMSFVDRESIMMLTEDLLVESWLQEFGEISSPFEQMKYDDAMELYGTDKPDLRLPYKLQNVTDIVKTSTALTTKTGIEYNDNFGAYAVVFPKESKNFSNSTKEQFDDISKRECPQAKLLQVKITENSWKTRLTTLFSKDVVDSIENRLNLQDGDMLFLSVGQKPAVQEILGKLLFLYTNILESKGITLRSPGFKWLWIVDFPLFSKENTENVIKATHHPFTQPHPEDSHLLTTDPLKVRGLHYDLVSNGWEIGGGSIRIHNSLLQKKVLEILGIDTCQMSHLLEALDSGAPPHGGIAFGLDRYIAMLCNATSIRDVIAFPKSMEGRDAMSGAPVQISDEDKKLYHIKTPAD
ncbi:aspartate--tRNA ligase, mitochondrial isoform X1 [Diprion similis]|uniref:aspartate--tRNA ligase, mitochondrial isoform X1 n=1 Tax=Diprion similis TaxID=362088 RepID=UPI001EF797A3|nr:aspartate--tRNA ligase, mitochondrial isoform X1 [Diprion similis]